MQINFSTIGVLALAALGGLPLRAQQPAVTNLQAKATGPTTVDLSWTAAAAASGYVVQRAIGSAAFDRLTPTKLTGTSYTDAAAPAGSALRYRIRALFANGQSSLSAPVGITTPSTPTASSSPSPSASPAATSAEPPPGQPTMLASPSTSGATAMAREGSQTRSADRQMIAGAQSRTRLTPLEPTGSGSQTAGGSPSGSGNPASFTAVSQGTRVLLTWSPAPGVSWYLLGGPGLPVTGRQVQGTSYTVGPLDPGGYEWTVASLEGEGRAPLTNWAYWPKAQAVISENTAGAYRIFVAGFRVNQSTFDDQLSRDGFGDEVFASVVWQRFDRATGQLLGSNTVTSAVHGDGNQAPERVPQGHASGNGGLAPGDVVPFGWDERSAQPALNPGRFPLPVWEGSLSDGGDVLVLRPTLWEADGDRTAYDWWLRFIGSPAATDTTWKLPRLQQSLANNGIQVIDGIGKSLYPNDTHLLYASPDIADQLAVGNSQPNYINPGRDRPIGLKQHYWCDELLVLDREKIEAELHRASQVAAPAGLITIPLEEEQGGTTPLRGNYVLYLRVERK